MGIGGLNDNAQRKRSEPYHRGQKEGREMKIENFFEDKPYFAIPLMILLSIVSVPVVFFIFAVMYRLCEKSVLFANYLMK
jgi:hypothetical protein